MNLNVDMDRMLCSFVLLVISIVVCRGQSDILHYHVWEERPPDTLVGNLTKDLDLLQRWTAAQVHQMTFTTITQQSSRYAEYFTVKPSLGIIFTNRIIDRDRICSQSTSCDVDITIRIDPINYFEIVKVKITINDRNDNPPTFSSQRVERTIVESANPGTQISIPSAEDLDSEENGIKLYTLEPADSPFQLDLPLDFQTSESLSLILKERLDREVNNFYKLTVLARDGGSPPLSGSIVVDIYVLDANDNNPQFDNFTYEITLYENTPIFTTIISVRATDLDEGLNGEVLYSFAPTTESRFGYLFGINNISGDIYLKQSVDYEQETSYSLSVMATDRGINSLPAYSQVIVNILDVNDNAPVIVINTLNNDGIATVMEGSNAGIFVAHVSVTDADGTANKVNCSLDSIYFDLTQLFESEYTVVTKRTFDREVKDEYHVNLVCQDNGIPPLTSTKLLAIKVTDANDNAPKFFQSSHTISIPENSAVGTSLIRFNATDADTGENAAILYKVRDSDLKWVKIDVISGVVTTSTVYDYETQNTTEVIVTATDQGKPVQSATATLLINVLDVNDDVAVFTSDSFVFSVPENSPAGTEVGKVSAQYSHQTLHSDIVYKIHGTSSTVPFIINQGLLYTTQPFDREIQANYKFQVLANNVSVANVIVNVLDENDNAPIISFPNVTNNYLEISDRTEPKTMLLTVAAHDVDEGLYSKLSYKVTDSSCNKELFAIESHTGEVYLGVPINATTGSLTCEVHVLVEDGGTPPLTDTVVIIFQINESIPYIPGNIIYARGTTTGPYTNGTLVMAAGKKSFWTTSTMFGIGIAAAVVFITIVVVIAVAVIKQRQKATDKDHTYNCRIQAEKVLMTPSVERSVIANTGSYNSKMTLDIDVGESNTDDIEWPSKLNLDLIQGTRGNDRSPRLSPNSNSTLSSCIRDSGLDVSWQDHPVKNVSVKEGSWSRHKHKKDKRGQLTDIEIEVHDVLHMLQNDADSETGSFTDSGKGPSEEGDQSGHMPPLEPHYTTVKQASKYDIPLVAEAHQMALQVMDEYKHAEGSPVLKENVAQPTDGLDNPIYNISRYIPASSKYHIKDVNTSSPSSHNDSGQEDHTDSRRVNCRLQDFSDSPPDYLTVSDQSKRHSSNTDKPGRGSGILLRSPINKQEVGWSRSPGKSSGWVPSRTPSWSSGKSPSESPCRTPHTSSRTPKSPSRKTHIPSSTSLTDSASGYTVGPVEICVHSVVNKYLPKGKKQRTVDDSTDCVSECTTTSGSYTVDNEDFLRPNKQNAKESIFV